MSGFYSRHEEKIKYLIVGVWNTLIGYLTFIILFYLFHERFNYLIILVLSNIIGITNSYLSYKFIVFKTRGHFISEYFRFYLIYGAAFLANMILMPFFVEVVGMKPIPAQGVILFFSLVFSYVGHKYYSFGTGANTLKRAFFRDREHS